MVWIFPKEPSPQKAKVLKTKQGVMFLVVFDIEGILLVHALPKGQHINESYYSKVKNKIIMIISYVELLAFITLVCHCIEMYRKVL